MEEENEVRQRKGVKEGKIDGKKKNGSGQSGNEKKKK